MTQKFNSFVFFFVVSAVSANFLTPVKECEGYEDLMPEVEVSVNNIFCERLPCDLPVGHTVKTTIRFSPRSTVSQISVRCNATIGEILLSYPLPNSKQTCNYLSVKKCPIPAGSQRELVTFVHMANSSPRLHADLIFYFMDQNRQIFCCFELDINIVD